VQKLQKIVKINAFFALFAMLPAWVRGSLPCVFSAGQTHQLQYLNAFYSVSEDGSLETSKVHEFFFFFFWSNVYI